MTTTTQKKTMTTGEGIAAVAAYATVDGAELAVAHLVSLGYDEHDVGIGPRDFEVVDRHPLRAGVNRWLRVGLLTGAGATAAVTVGREIGGQALVGTVLPMVAWGAIFGLLAGLAVAVVSYRRDRAKAFVSAPDVVAPTRYEVVVDRDHDRARHGLAKWWDPSAPPAGWQQPA